MHNCPLYYFPTVAIFVKNRKHTMSLQENLGRTIVRLRREKGFSQESFANEAGIDRRYMSDIENGKRNISIDILERICNKLGMKMSELFVEVEKGVNVL